MMHFLPRKQLQGLLALLQQQGYRCIGPQLRDGAIVYENLHQLSQLPQGVSDVQAPASYRLESHASERYFAWANGPQGIKPHLFAPSETLWQVVRDDEGRLRFAPSIPEVKPIAFIAARPCDLAALALQDQHFLDGQQPDPYYAARREGMLIVAVNCSHPAATCFCHSTGDGPEAKAGYDLLLDELDEGFAIKAGSSRGESLLAQLEPVSMDSAQQQGLDKQHHQAQQQLQQQPRRMPDASRLMSLYQQLDHSRWDEVATRCLSCGNCTAVCPTCFCHSERDETALDGGESAHLRQWDSCFSQGHSYIHGHTLREETRLRYRQWLSHKLAGWQEQFGRSGCVGCGRCISWCPVGIDLTEEAYVICNGEEEAKDG